MLVQLSVARHSAGYWHNVVNIQKEKSPYYNDWINVDAQLADCKLCDVVGADAVGGLVGSLGGPAGAAGGAAVASAASVLDFWPW